MSQDKSAPTYGSFAFDVPEPQSFSGEFVYNYFLKDERVSDNAYSDVSAVTRHGGDPARYIQLEYTALSNVTNLPDPDRSLSTRKSDLSSYSNSIVSEIGVQSERTVFMATQDDELAAELQAAVEAELVLAEAAERGLSPLEAALKYNSITSDRISASDILETTDSEATYNLSYYDPATGEDLTVQKQGGVSEYAIGGFYNKKFILDILEGSENIPFSPLWGTISSSLTEAEEIQELATSTLDSNTAAMSDYEFTVEAISESLVTMGAEPKSVELCGYIIEKYLVDDNGDTTLLEILTEANLNKTGQKDEAVIYGKNYRYLIKAVYYLSTMVAGSSSAGEIIYQTFLISSRGSPYIDVVTNEIVPPPPPENIQFFLNTEQKLMIVWDMPYNTQEDIKRFQIFRRAALEDPYTIIAQIDFDDSEELTDRAEYIPDYSQLTVERQRVDYTDEEFEFDNSYYYAICSVDAHDLSSPYSSQFKVIYDRIDGKMDTEFIAFAGAPKAYPNFTLKTTLTVDCLKDSGHDKMKIYFDPECLQLQGVAETIESVTARADELYLETNQDKAMYKFQIINLDRQQDIKLDIYLKKSAGYEMAAEEIGLYVPGTYYGE